MRQFFWFVIGIFLFTLPYWGMAQDSLTFNATPLTLTPSSIIDASTALRWRLSGTVGYHQQFPNEYSAKSFYLTNGFGATVAADYLIGRTWGLGLLLGYQNLVVGNDYKRDSSIPRFNGSLSTFFPITAFHSFMIAVGPAFAIPLGRRLTFDLDVRGGGFFNDSPVIKAYSVKSLLDTTVPSLTILPSDQRFRLGITGNVGLKYQFTQQFGLGVSVNINRTSFNYTQIRDNTYTQNSVDLSTYGIQATVSYRFLSLPRQRSTTTGATAPAVVVTPKPACYPPVLDPAQQNEYEVGSLRRPVIRWRSSAPIYAEGERYVFRLYTLPGNKLLYEQTVQEPQLNWPAQLAIPDTASYYFYSIHTTRSDDLEQTCRSEPVVGTLGFLSRQSSAPTFVEKPRVPTYAFTLRLYELQPTLVYEKAPIRPVSEKTPKSVKKTTRSTKARSTQPVQPPVSTSALVRSDSARSGVVQSDSARTRSMATDSVRSQLATSDSTRSDSLVLSMRIVPNLLHEEPVQQLDFVWPGKIPLPSQPTVYQYTVSRNSTQELIRSHYLLVEPDGCSLIINEAMKNKRLRMSLPPTKQPEPTQPTNKGKP